jgi:hypothetical protein
LAVAPKLWRRRRRRKKWGGATTAKKAVVFFFFFFPLLYALRLTLHTFLTVKENVFFFSK